MTFSSGEIGGGAKNMSLVAMWRKIALINSVKGPVYSHGPKLDQMRVLSTPDMNPCDRCN